MEFFKFELPTQNINKYLNILFAFEPNTIKAKVEISESWDALGILHSIQ